MTVRIKDFARDLSVSVVTISKFYMANKTEACGSKLLLGLFRG